MKPILIQPRFNPERHFAKFIGRVDNASCMKQVLHFLHTFTFKPLIFEEVQNW